MTAKKRFKHTHNRIGMQFISYDDKHVLLGTFADADGVKHIVELLNEQHETIQQLQGELDKTIEMLNKEINTSEKAFDGLLKENEQLKQQIKDMKIRFKRKYDHEFDEIVDELW